MKDVFIDFNVKFGLEKLWKWKWWLVGACVVAAISSFIYADLKHPEYMSEAAFIPPEISSLNEMVFNSGVSYRGFEAAEDEDIDRTVDYLTSRQVIDSISRQYKLYEHYGIDRSDKFHQKSFDNMIAKKHVITYSDRSTVVVRCFDVDSVWAANIANTYLEFAENFFEMVSQRKRGFEATKVEMEGLNAERDALVDSLAYLRKQYKLYHIDHAPANVGVVIASQIKSNPKFNELYDAMISMELQLNFLEERVSDISREYTSRKMNLEQYPSLIKVTKRAKPTTYKARPKRAIYVIVACMATLILGSFLVVMLDREKDNLPI